MALLSAQDLISLSLKLCSEPDGLTALGNSTPQPKWPRSDVLQVMNLQQSKIATELPGLFNHVDQSLTTTGNPGGYVIPSVMGNIRDIEIGGNPCVWSSRDELIAMSLRGDIEQNWEQTVGSVSPLYTFYCFIEMDDSSGSLQPTLYTYPICQAGQPINLTGELLLSNAADSATSFPFQSVPYLEKAQEVLAKLTSQWFAMKDNRQELYTMINNEIFGPEGSTNNRGLMGRLQVQYLILRNSPRPPMIVVKNSEDAAASNEFKWTRTTLPG